MKIAAYLRVFLFLFSLLFVFLFSVNFAFAQIQSPSPAPTNQAIQTNPNTTPNTNPDVPKNLHNWTQNVMIEVMLSLTCQLVGIDPTQPNGQCLGVDQKTGKIGFLPAGNIEKGEIGGAIGGMNGMISALYKPPIRTSDYFQNLAENFGIVKKTHAQQTGTGFEGLKPLLNLWTAFRNMVYLVFVIVFIVIGLAIMLRIKIDPRTVMTIQNQIPKIIIGILLVTFSFAIAGFLVDMMWIMIYLVFGLIAGISPDIAKSVKDLNPIGLQGKSPFGAAIGFGQLSSMVGDVARSSTGIIQSLLGIEPTWDKFIPFFGEIKSIGGFLTNLINKGIPFPAWNAGNPISFTIDTLSTIASFATWRAIMGWDSPSVGLSVLGFGADVDLGWITNLPIAAGISALVYPLVEVILRVAVPYLIVYLIVFIALLIALFRLWFSLLMAYINILIDVVLAPFWIVGSLVPGSPVSAVGWLRDLIANLAAFPVVIAMFLLGKVFVDAFKTATNPFVPPLIGNPGDMNAIGSLIGIGIILMTPNVVTALKAALKAPKVDTGGIGKAFGPALSAPMRLSQVGLGRMTTKEDPTTGFVTYKKGALGLIGRYLGTRGQ